MAYTIIEVARQTGISQHTLRFWARNGLFDLFVQKDLQGVKYFDKKGVEWIVWIDCLRVMGMSIKDIKTYNILITQGIKSAKQRREMLLKQSEALNKQLHSITQAKAKLEHKIAIYDEMIRTNKDLLNPISKDYKKMGKREQK